MYDSCMDSMPLPCKAAPTRSESPSALLQGVLHRAVRQLAVFPQAAGTQAPFRARR